MSGRSRSRPATDLPSVQVSLDGLPVQGSGTAKVVLIEYSDFQCPYCAEFARITLPDIRKDYILPGKVLFAFRHFPLATHAFASEAAEAAVCAGRQGRFWEMHDRLFDLQQAVSQSSFDGLASDLHLNSTEFASCVTGEGVGRVAEDVESAKRFDISGTPAFQFGFLEGEGSARLVKAFSGARPIGDFRSILDRLLADMKK